MFVINKGMCVSCHNCASECPRQAIHFVGTKYEIDQEKCVKCGLCAKVCHTGACHEEPKIKGAVQTHDLIERECDIVVVGSGSGLVSAVMRLSRARKSFFLRRTPRLAAIQIMRMVTCLSIQNGMKKWDLRMSVKKPLSIFIKWAKVSLKNRWFGSRVRCQQFL